MTFPAHTLFSHTLPLYVCKVFTKWHELDALHDYLYPLHCVILVNSRVEKGSLELKGTNE